jgi:hypothetical protein
MPYYYSKVRGICQGVFEIFLVKLKGDGGGERCVVAKRLFGGRSATKG